MKKHTREQVKQIFAAANVSSFWEKWLSRGIRNNISAEWKTLEHLVSASGDLEAWENFKKLKNQE